LLQDKFTKWERAIPQTTEILSIGKSIYFSILTSFHAIKRVAFACEATFSVSFLVIEKLLQFCKHLSTVSADQNIRVA
jgi:hypothetical protein